MNDRAQHRAPEPTDEPTMPPRKPSDAARSVMPVSDQAQRRRSLAESLREFADALDKDRGHSKSYVTLLMREAATELDVVEQPVTAEVRKAAATPRPTTRGASR